MSDLSHLSQYCEYYAPTKKAKSIKNTEKFVNRGKSKKSIVVNAINKLPDEIAGMRLNGESSWTRHELFKREWTRIESQLSEWCHNMVSECAQRLYQFHRNIRAKNNFTNLRFARVSQNSLSSQETIIRNFIQLTSEESDENDTTFIEFKPSSIQTIKDILEVFHEKIFTPTFCNAHGIDKSHIVHIFEIFEVFSKISKSDRSDHFVIALYQFESFDKEVVKKLISSLCHCKGLYFTFVLLTHNPLKENTRTVFPIELEDELEIEDIKSLYEPQQIRTLLRRLVESGTTRFRLHPELIEKLLFQLNKSELSFDAFAFYLKAIVLDHFYSNPISTLGQDEMDFRQSLASDCQLKLVFENTLPNQTQLDYVDHIWNQYTEFTVLHHDFVLNLNVIIALLQHLNLVSRKEEDELYLKYYFEIGMARENYNFSDDPLWKQLYQQSASNYSSVITHLTSTTFKKLLPNSDDNARIRETLFDFKRRLTELMHQEEKEMDLQRKSIRKLGLDCEVEIVKDKLRNVQSRAEWRQSLDPRKLKKDASKFQHWRNELVEALELALRNTSPGTRHRSLIDAFCYNGNFWSQSFEVPFGKCLQRWLNKPSGSANSFKQLYPSFYILNQYLQREGARVDLFDLYQQFSEEKSLKHQFDQSEMLVHFINSLLDLEYLGILRGINRSNIEKLIF